MSELPANFWPQVQVFLFLGAGYFFVGIIENIVWLIKEFKEEDRP